MRRLWKALLRSLAFVFLLAVLLLGAVAMLLNTETGSRFVIGRIVAAVPGSLAVERVEGTLWRTLHVGVVHYRDENIDLRTSDVGITISWPAALAGSAVVRQFTAGELSYQSLAPGDSSPSPLSIEMPPLPLGIDINAASIDALIVSGSASDLRFERIELTGAAAVGSRLRFELLSTEYAGTEFVFSNVATTLSGDVPLTTDLRWQRTDGTWSGEASAGGSLDELQISHTLNNPYEVTTEGIVRLINRVDPEFDLQFTSPRYVIGDLEITDGDVSFIGTTNDYETLFSGTIAEPRIPDLSVRGDAAGNTEGFRSTNFDVQSELGNVSADGAVNWLPSLTASLSMQLQDFDPAKVGDLPSGNIDATLLLVLAGPDDWRLTISEVAGTVNDSELQAVGTLILTPGQFECRSCSAVVDTIRISADGIYSDALVALDVSVDAPTLSMFWPDIDRHLVANSRMDGTTTEVNVELDLTYGEFGTLSAAGNVARSDAGITGSVNRASIDEPNTGRWVLGTPLAFRTGAESTEIGSHRWLPPSGELLISQVSVTPGQLSVVATLSSLPLAIANPFLPEGYQLDGQAAADIDISRSGGEWFGSADWEQTGTILQVTQPGGETYRLQIPTATVTAKLANDTANFQSNVRINPGISLDTTVGIKGLGDDPQIDARVRLEGESWDWITSFVPELDNFGGDVSADLSATGPLNAPTLSGQATWLGGSAAIPTLNVPLTEANVIVIGAADGSATIAGSAKLGDGAIGVHGRFADLMKDNRRIELNLTGNATELINWPEYHLWTTPDLQIVGTTQGWDAQGELAIPKADIIVRELPENAVVVSPDIRTADVDFSTAQSATRYSGEAQVRFGEEVHISAFGLDTRIEGELVIRKAPDRELSATGRLTLVDGEFTAYGQRLTIEEGTLTFTGPLDDPIVDVRATRSIESFDRTIVAGIQLRGRAQELTSTVFSDPDMSEADALSYLLIGRPLAEATDTEGGDLSTAAVGLGLRQASRVTQQVGQSIGLDQLTVVGDGGDATALVAGKQINSRLYARYAYGVFSRLGMIMIRYKLSERLSLEAGAGETQSIDIVYTVEKE